MLIDSHPLTTRAALRRHIPAPPQLATFAWQERDMRVLPIEAQLAVRVALAIALRTLKPRRVRQPRRTVFTWPRSISTVCT
jgi:hypothetical protein